MHEHTLQSTIALIWSFFQRDVRERYTGTVLGIGWLLIQPLFMLALYTLVFGEVLQLRFGSAASTAGFALYLFGGLLVFNAFAEVLTRAPAVLIERRDLLLNTPLPAWILPLLPVATSVLLELLAVLILLLAAVLQGGWHATVLIYYWPYLLVRVLFALAASYALSALGVFLRDLRQMMPAILTILLFISPILYPLEVIPERFRPWYEWNVLGQLVQGYREVLLDGVMEWGRWAALLVLSCLLLALSVLLFRSLEARARYVL